MKARTGLIFVGLLCLYIHCSLAKRVRTWVCRHQEGYIKTFFDKDNMTKISLPCRAKMANIHCGGSQTIIHADNSLHFVSGIIVNITTANDDGTVTYQALTVNGDTLRAYIKEGNFTKSPWGRILTGSEVDESRRVVGEFEAMYRTAWVINGGLTVGFALTGRLIKASISCKDPEFRTYETYPETLCGGPDNTYLDGLAIDREIPADQHHYQRDYRNDYIMLARQDVQQPSPLCEEASRIASGECSDLGNKLYECQEFYRGFLYGGCLRDNKVDSFKVYVACMRVLCGAEDTSSEDTCQTLQQVADVCGDMKYSHSTSDAHMKISELLSLTTCPPGSTPIRADPDPDSEPTNGENGGTCRVRDKDNPYWAYPGTIDPFFKRWDGLYRDELIRVELPCKFKLANIKCGGAKTVIFAEHSIDIEGLVYMSAVTVTISTTNADGTTTYQTNRLTNRKLKKYIKKGNLQKRLWRWKYSGGAKPKPKDRILGQYNQTTVSGVLVHRGLRVTYRYIDPRNDSRLEGDALVITCTDPNFKAYQDFPETVCGSLETSYFAIDDIAKKIIPGDRHHWKYRRDIFMLARQNVRQSNPLCQEASSIVSGECNNLGDQLYDCHWLHRPPQNQYDSFAPYGKCMRENGIDAFKVYVSCLRVLCRSEAASSEDTCNTLRQVYDVCGDIPRTHMNMSQLLFRTNCSTVATPATAETG